mmetsp:Transcript_59840/g.96900  ORF Transcript_59840/g.96900 Transcript_59840/m.96900 type:complete len:227 (-) Transcript_59840:2794-3474(-)
MLGLSLLVSPIEIILETVVTICLWYLSFFARQYSFSESGSSIESRFHETLHRAPHSDDEIGDGKNNDTRQDNDYAQKKSATVYCRLLLFASRIAYLRDGIILRELAHEDLTIAQLSSKLVECDGQVFTLRDLQRPGGVRSIQDGFLKTPIQQAVFEFLGHALRFALIAGEYPCNHIDGLGTALGIKSFDCIHLYLLWCNQSQLRKTLDDTTGLLIREGVLRLSQQY